MPSQDLLFPILPRAPAALSSDDTPEVTQISQKSPAARPAPTTVTSAAPAALSIGQA